MLQKKPLALKREDPDLDSESGYGSTGLTETGSNPDPENWLYLAWADCVDARHAELVLNALLEAGDLLVMDVRVRDEDVGQLVLVHAPVAHPASRTGTSYVTRYTSGK
jgi:hypothetical protein